jgi:cytochrome c5
MKLKYAVPAALITMVLSLTLMALGSGDKEKDKDAPPAAASASHAVQDDTMRLEGERMYHANCGRCHAAPPKFAPRMAATIVRHMRVRATITDQEMHVILRYLSR